MGEYERVKRKEHPAYKLAKVFFNKYYNRYKQSEIYKIYFPENGSEV